MAKTEAAHIPMMAAVVNFFGSSVRGSKTIEDLGSPKTRKLVIKSYLLLKTNCVRCEHSILNCKLSIFKFRSALGTNAHYACSKHNSFQYDGDSFPHKDKKVKNVVGWWWLSTNKKKFPFSKRETHCTSQS